ncbi:thioredoxin-like protein [Pilobolus umbonatus]|nr:thioredoxin-like protein [Pilobolus umbonatus]
MLPPPAVHDDKARRYYCNSRRIRVIFLALLTCIATLLMVTKYNDAPYQRIIQEDIIIQDTRQEVIQYIKEYRLIVFSKTYCAYSMNAKRILNTYNLKRPLKVIEVDLREDQDKVKSVLYEISGRDTYPNIFVSGKTIGGSDDLQKLHQNGQLQILLQENNLI